MGKPKELEMVRKQRDEVIQEGNEADQQVTQWRNKLVGAIESVNNFNKLIAKMDPTGPEAEALKAQEK